MTHRQKMLAGILYSLALGAGAQAAVNDSQTNPYQPIVARNVFGLKPPPPPASTEPPKPPPPKITLTGIFTVLGPKKAILKATLPPKPGEPAKEQTFTLAEGEREGEIEVLKIDVKNATVKVNDYGVETNLVFDKITSTTVAGAAPPPPGPGGVPPPGGNPFSQGGKSIPRTLRLPGASVPSASSGVPANNGAQGMSASSVGSMSTATGSIGMVGAAPALPGTEPGVNLGGLLTTPAQTAQAPILSSADSPDALAAAAQRTPEENVLLYEANRLKNEQAIASGARIPRMPQHPFLGGAGAQDQTQQQQQQPQMPQLPFPPGGPQAFPQQ
ncbi:MAG TPA: hypothetical protein VN829_14320 [Dongiaceae bacterium]|nr:exported hypothetical protein [Verrucomicrobiota bacterium]HXP61667.1 hypothetical protein [Dongiaceae bacterium]